MGYFDRYMLPGFGGIFGGNNPFNPRQDQPTGFGMPPMMPPIVQQRLTQGQQADMPWGNDGQAFGDLYNPAPKPAPRAPTAPTRSNFGQPYQLPQQPAAPVPEFNMPDNSTGTPITPQDASWAAYNPSEAQKVDRQPQAGDQATGNGKGALFGDMNGMDMLSLGLSLLGNSQNGGDWGQVGRDLQGIQQNAMSREDRAREIERQKTADQRAQEEFDAWRKEQKRLQGMQDRYNAALEDPTLDEESKRLLGIMGPEGYGQYQLWQAEQKARTKEAETQRTFESGENAKNRAASIEEARVRSANDNSIDKYFQAMDAETLGKGNAEAAQLQSRGLPMLKTLQDNINKAGEQLTGKPLDANSRITLGRLFNGSSSDRQTLETWRARVLGPALETLRGLGAMSEREMEAAINAFSNPDMTLGAAKELIDERIRLAENKLLENKTMNKFFADAKGITGKHNAAGQDWNTALTLAFEEDRKAREKQRQASAPAPVAAPKVGEVRDGYRYVGGDPGDPNSWQSVNLQARNPIYSGSVDRR